MRSGSLRDHTAPLTGPKNQVVRVVAIAAFLAGVLFQGAPAVAAPKAASSEALTQGIPEGVRPTGDDKDEWIEEFLEILRRIYEGLGGDPRRLGNTPEVAMLNVSIRVVLFGVPGNLSPAQTDALLADIDSAVTMLNEAPESVSIGSFADVLAEIVSILS